MKNQVVIITGANSGIGYAVTQTLLESGYQVAALDIWVDNLNEIKASFPDQLLVFNCDVSDRQQVEKSVSSVIDQWEHVDVLVNNACLAIFKAFEDRSIEETRQEFEVNYFGYLHMIYAVLPFMKAQGQGIIHNLSSGVGLTGFRLRLVEYLRNWQKNRRAISEKMVSFSCGVGRLCHLA